MTQEKLDSLVAAHELWLETDGKKGKMLELSGENLHELIFNSRNLRRAKLEKCSIIKCNFCLSALNEAYIRNCTIENSNFSYCDLSDADISHNNFQGCNFHEVNLFGARMIGSDFTGVNSDYSCFPLWCGWSRFKADNRFVAQVLAHLCSLDVQPEARAELDKVLDFARTSHRAYNLGITKEETE